MGLYVHETQTAQFPKDFGNIFIHFENTFHPAPITARLIGSISTWKIKIPGGRVQINFENKDRYKNANSRQTLLKQEGKHSIASIFSPIWFLVSHWDPMPTVCSHCKFCLRLG